MEFYREIDWLVFFLCCLFNIIVLFNVLIAIISETYTAFSEKKHSAGYRAKVQMMDLMQDSVFGIIMSKQSKPNHTELLFIAKVIDKDEVKDEE